MIINLIKSKQMFSLTLPNKIKGQYWITDIDSFGSPRSLLSVEAIEGRWVLKSNKTACLLGSNEQPVKSMVLEAHSLINLKISGEEERVILFVESIDDTRQTFRKVVVKNKDIFFIGRNKDNNFYYENSFVSGKHARLAYDGRGWEIFDNGSTNGTYVNGYSVTASKLTAGDLIYIMGLKIVIGDNYLAINNPDGLLKINSNNLWEYVPQEVKVINEEVELPKKEYFYRSPRIYRDFDCVEIKIDEPPQRPKQDALPTILMIAPSITMGMAALSTSILTLTNIISSKGDIKQAIPSLVMAVSMLLGTILWPLISKRYEKNKNIKNEQKRQEKYMAYLQSIRDEIKKTAREQSEILNENMVSATQCADRVISQSRNLWERYVGNKDFLKLRLGKGNLPLDAKINCTNKKFSMDEDNLWDAMLQLGKERKELENVPISVSLMEKRVLGMYGEKYLLYSLAKSMLIQLVSYHSYDEVKLMFITDENEIGQWDFIKSLPHIWNNDKTERYLATNQEEVKELSVYIEKHILSRLSDRSYDKKEYVPHFVIISTDRKLSDKCESLKQLIKKEEDCGVSLIYIEKEIKDLPKEAKVIINVDKDKSYIYDRENDNGMKTYFVPEAIEDGLLIQAVGKLSNINLEMDGQGYALPNVMTFLEMFNVSKIEHLNILTRWKENNPTKSLQTPVGVDSYGAAFNLDLHEKFHGPHGLIAGMTGSGKSEFIITFILSLAVNYHPDEVAFILIDYKGGGLAGAFENPDKNIKLPHLAGTITNLDGAAVKRSLISIDSELRRRQRIFKEVTRKVSNEGTMDIYKYQQLYRDKVVDEPLPHLFIISDEFAELKSQQPEFMEQLVTAARIGRSLGVHLILATQKPSGVVDDQIWSNSRFRVCLKVQEKADSQDMIKCPDAAAISQTGRFYLQVGFNELFALGQSAYSGADYIPTETVEKSIDDSIEVVDNLGRSIVKVKHEKKEAENKNNSKQIVSVINYLSEIANEENIFVKPMWLLPIPEFIYLREIEEKYDTRSFGIVLNPVVGEYDDPFNQKQSVLTLPISSEGNCLIYGATGNGKTTLLTTLCYSLIKNHTVNELNMYIMDFGSETLKVFENCAVVGDVICSNEEEKVTNLFKMLNEEMNKRRTMFSSYGGDYLSYCLGSGKAVPNIVVVLNNYSGFAEQYENLNTAFSLLTRDGVKYGIYFVMTSSGTSAVRYILQKNFKIMLSMQLNNPTEYATILGKTDGVVPSKYKGRGLIALDKVYEFQTAYCERTEDLFEFLRNFAMENGKASKDKARKVPILPKVVSVEHVSSHYTGLSKVPIGIYKQSLQVAVTNIMEKVITAVFVSDIEDAKEFVSELAKLTAIAAKTYCVDLDRLEIASDGSFSYIGECFNEFALEMIDEMSKRHNEYKLSDYDDSVLEKYDERVYLILGIGQFIEEVSKENKNDFKKMLEIAQSKYKMSFVLIDSANNSRKYNTDSWYIKHITGTEGIWIGDGITSNHVFKLNKMTRQMQEEIGSDYGYLIEKSKASLVKLLQSGSKE